MPLVVTVAEIEGRKISKSSKILIFLKVFGPPCRNPLANVDGSMAECAQVCALHARLHLTMLRKTETVDGSVALGVICKIGIVT